MFALNGGHASLCPPYGSSERSEAIHSFFTPQDGLLRFARNDVELQTRVRDLAAQCARAVDKSSAQRGRGERRAPTAPAASRALCIGRTHTSKRVHRNRPAFSHAMVLTVSFVLSPVTGLFCHRRQRISRVCARSGRLHLRELDASVGASGPHDFAVHSNRLSSACSLIAHGFIEPALQPRRAQNAAASTASRSASVTIAIRPSVGGMARVLEVIWVRREWKYFWKQDWTGGISLIPQEIFPSSFRGNAKHRTRNLEIPRCAIAHLRPGANAPSRNVAFGLLRRFALSELRSALCSLIASRPSGDDPFCNPNLKVKPFPRPQCLVWGRSGHLSISR